MQRTPGAAMAWSAGGLLLLVLFSSVQADARELSMKEAVRLALANNPEIKLAQTGVDKAVASQKSTRGEFGPKLQLEANFIHWDEAQQLDFDLGGNGGEPSPTCQTLFETMAQCGLDLSSMAGMTIQERNTWGVTVTVAQPLTPIYAVYHGYRLKGLGVRLNQLALAIKRLEIAFRVRVAYLRVLQAMEFAEITQAGIEQVEAHLTKVKEFVRAGLVGKNDQLKVEVALADIREKRTQARVGVTMARSVLCNLIGLPIDTEVKLTDAFSRKPGAFDKTQQQCTAEALKNRLELKTLARQRDMAKRSKKLAYFDFIPSVNAVASYQHNEGSELMDKNVFFVGAFLEWNVWEWGKSYYKVKETQADIARADVAYDQVTELIKLEVKKSYLELRAAEANLATAEKTIEQAEENLRIERHKYEANTTTTTEVLDAQSALTRARSSYASSLYNYYIALEALTKAMGIVEGSHGRGGGPATTPATTRATGQQP